MSSEAILICLWLKIAFVLEEGEHFHIRFLLSTLIGTTLY